MESQTTTTVQVPKEVKGTIVPSFNLPTPLWMTWIFRIVFCMTTAATMIITAEPSIPNDLKVRIFLYMKAADFVIWFVGKGMGVEKKQFEADI